MANPKGHLKLTGDTHLPDVESDLAVEEGAAALAPLARERTQPGRATVVRRAGMLRDRDDATDSGIEATAADSAGADATPSVRTARPVRPAQGPRPAAAGVTTSQLGTIAWMVVGAWLALKLLRR